MITMIASPRVRWRGLPALALVFAAALLLGCTETASETASSEMASSEEPRVEVTPEPDQQRVAVQVAGEPFTAYLFDERRKELAKPVLYPIHSAGGAPITRGYPIDPRPGERVDHPHHIGHWLNYGDVNGLDFWNNTGDVPAEEEDEVGHIVHRQVVGTESGSGQGELEVQADWRGPDEEPLLRENTRFVFRAGPDRRVIDRITRLTATDRRVELTDNKEGFFAIRVARELEHPAEDPIRIVGQEGTPREDRVLNNEGVTGQYLNADGVTDRPVWGTRSPWMLLQGVVGGDSVGVAILDHPENVGHPTYWHARGYGLFSANPLGQAVFSDGEERLDYALESGESVTFRHRILVLSDDVSSSTMQSEYDQWSRTALPLAEAPE